MVSGVTVAQSSSSGASFFHIMTAKLASRSSAVSEPCHIPRPMVTPVVPSATKARTWLESATAAATISHRPTSNGRNVWLE